MKRATIVIAAVLAVSIIATLSRSITYEPANTEYVVESWRSAAAGAGDWVEAPDMRTRFHRPTLVQGGYLWGVDYQSDDCGIYYFDGETVRLGAIPRKATGDVQGNRLWGDGTNIYLMIASAVVITATETGGGDAFTQGEPVTQDDSGATGWFIRSSGNLIYIHVNTGTFAQGAAGSHTIIGDTSAAEWEAEAVATIGSDETVLLRSGTPTDSSTYFVAVHEFQDKIIQNSFCDAGVITDLANKQTLFFCSSQNDASEVNSVWYNHPADGDTWTKLFDCVIGTGHHHGMRVVRDVNGVSGTHKLYMLTGDSDEDAAVLVCNDIADFVNTPATWETRWAFDEATDATREAYRLTGDGADYCVHTGDQRGRLIDFCVDADVRYAYAIPDAITETNRPVKIDLVNDTLISFGTAVVGGGGLGAPNALSNGAILFGTFSAYSGGWQGTDDGWLRLYALGEDNDVQDFYEVWARPRKDIASPASGMIYFQDSILEYPAGDTSIDHPALVWWNCPVSRKSPAGYTAVGHYSPRNDGHKTFSPKASLTGNKDVTNLFPGGRFKNAELPGWVTANATIAHETTTVDAVGGQTTALKITPTVATARAYYELPLSVVHELRGKLITISVRVLNNPGADQQAGLLWEDGIRYQKVGMRPEVSADWQTHDMTVLIPPTAEYGRISLIAKDDGGGTTGATYWSDLRIVEGCRQDRVPLNLAYVGSEQDDFERRASRYASYSALLTAVGTPIEFVPLVGTWQTTASNRSRVGRTYTFSDNVNNFDTAPIPTGYLNTVVFNGTDEEADAVDGAWLTFSDDASSDDAVSIGMYIWVDSTGNGTTRTLIAKWDETTGSEDREWALEIDSNNKLKIRLYDETNDAEIYSVSDTAIATDEWVHVQISYTGNDAPTGILQWVNGKTRAETGTDDVNYDYMVDGASKVTIACKTGTGGTPDDFFKGRIGYWWLADEAVTWDSAWSAFIPGAGLLDIPFP